MGASGSRIMIPLLAVLAWAPATPSRAYEVDNFTGRAQLTQDSLVPLNSRINWILEQAVERVNRTPFPQCDATLLRNEVSRWTGPDPMSFLELWANFSSEVQTVTTPFAESVYAGATAFEAPMLWAGGIAKSLKIGGHVIGTDKLGHFFMQGLDYFKRVELDGVKLETVLTQEHGEDGIWGMWTTGVRSYADMATNFQGYRFWTQLSGGPNPYVRCLGGVRWVRAREFDWTDYVSDAWDEAINCSEFKPSLAAKVERNLALRGQKCSIHPTACLALHPLDRAEYYLSPRCRNVSF